MTADPILTLAWLVLAHLVADFGLQTGAIVAAKSSRGGRALRGLLAHAVGVAAAMVPFALAFGIAGLWALVAVTVSHVVIDRAKVVVTRRSEARALAAAHRRHEGRAPAAGLGRAWTPMPAAWFALDQLAHATVLGIAWAVWLADAPLASGWLSAVDAIAGGRDTATVHAVTLHAVVLTSLAIVNIRAGAIFVATLVRPIEAATELGGANEGPETEPPATPPAAPQAERPRGWSFRIGPIEGRAVEDPPARSGSAGAAAPDRTVAAGERTAVPPPSQVGATIGIIERLLIVTFVLAGADAAIGFVVGAKTIARFRQLDDRDFAEYYLLGTLASVSIAILSAIVARAALGG